MAVFLAPVAALGVGGTYLLAFSKAHSAAANLSAKQAFGIEKAYPWPFWKPWFNPEITSNSTTAGKLSSLALFGLSFGVQKRLIWRHLGNSLRVADIKKSQRIKTTGQFLKIVGPGIAENSINGLVSCTLVGFVQPYVDGNNQQSASDSSS